MIKSEEVNSEEISTRLDKASENDETEPLLSAYSETLENISMNTSSVKITAEDLMKENFASEEESEKSMKDATIQDCQRNVEIKEKANKKLDDETEIIFRKNSKAFKDITKEDESHLKNTAECSSKETFTTQKKSEKLMQDNKIQECRKNVEVEEKTNLKSDDETDILFQENDKNLKNVTKVDESSVKVTAEDSMNEHFKREEDSLKSVQDNKIQECRKNVEVEEKTNLKPDDETDILLQENDKNLKNVTKVGEPSVKVTAEDSMNEHFKREEDSLKSVLDNKIEDCRTNLENEVLDCCTSFIAVTVTADDLCNSINQSDKLMRNNTVFHERHNLSNENRNITSDSSSQNSNQQRDSISSIFQVAGSGNRSESNQEENDNIINEALPGSEEFLSAHSDNLDIFAENSDPVDLLPIDMDLGSSSEEMEFDIPEMPLRDDAGDLNDLEDDLDAHFFRRMMDFFREFDAILVEQQGAGDHPRDLNEVD